MSDPSLSALDQEREASMADEGGAAGAIAERQDDLIREVPTDRASAFSERAKWLGVAAAATGTVFVLSRYRHLRRNRK